jgi:hypothetical protein
MSYRWVASSMSEHLLDTCLHSLTSGQTMDGFQKLGPCSKINLGMPNMIRNFKCTDLSWFTLALYSTRSKWKSKLIYLCIEEGTCFVLFCNDTRILRTLGLWWCSQYCHETIEKTICTLIILPIIDMGDTKKCMDSTLMKSLELNMSRLKWTRVEENGLK